MGGLQPMTKTGYPFIQLEGNPFERGRIYGKECSNLIRKSISNYSFMFKTFSGMSWEEAKERARSYIPFIAEYSPQLIEEMKGIAEGQFCILTTLSPKLQKRKFSTIHSMGAQPSEFLPPFKRWCCLRVSKLGLDSKTGRYLVIRN